jgi:WD40 repeat protein
MRQETSDDTRHIDDPRSKEEEDMEQEPHKLVLEFTRANDAGDSYAYEKGPQEYIRQRSDKTTGTAKIKWDNDLLGKIDSLREWKDESKRDPKVFQELGNLLRDFLGSTGLSSDEAKLLADAEAGERVVVTIRSSAAELYALPWELLTLGQSMGHLGAKPNVVVRYEWPGTTPKPKPTAPRPEGGRVLFAWSNVGGDVGADRPLKAIEAACEKGGVPFNPDRDELKQASCQSIVAALAKAKDSSEPIAVLHLLCHGGPVGSGNFGLMLNLDKSGDPDRVDAGQLANLLRPYADMVELVVITACDGANNGTLGNQLGSVAQALHRAGITAVVASRYPLSIPGSEAFTEAFYRELLVTPRSVEQAFVRARDDIFKRRSGSIDWASLQLFACEAAGDDTRPVVIRPYQGLRRLEGEQSRFFFGRDKEVEELINDLGNLVKSNQPRFLVIQGWSGTGKSSMVMAGAVPKLLAPSQGAGGALGDPRFQLRYAAFAEMKPGRTPMTTLAQKLADTRVGRLLLVVDQLEEIFTQAPKEEGEQFARHLWKLASDPSQRVSVLLTVRSDFIGRLGEILLDEKSGTRLDKIANDEAYSVRVSQLTKGQLREVIEKPAACVGLRLENGLVDTMLRDIGTDISALPLIAYTLELLWRGRRGRDLTMAEYTKIGTVTGALCNHADQLIASLDDRGKDLAERLFVALSSQERDVSATDTRQRLVVKEIRDKLCRGSDASATLAARLLSRTNSVLAKLRPSSAKGALQEPRETRAQREQRFDEVLEKLQRDRLLVTEGEGDQTTIEVAHEVLLRNWKQLDTWRTRNAELMRREKELTTWLDTYTRKGTLLNDKQILDAASFKKAYPGAFTDEAQALLAKSEKKIKVNRLLVRGVAVVMSLLAIIAGIYANDASDQEHQARTKTREAETQKRRADDATLLAEAERSLTDNDPLTAMQFLGFVQEPDQRKDWMRLTLETLRSAPMRHLGGHNGRVMDAAWSPDNAWVVTGSADNTARVWSLKDRKQVKVLVGHRGSVLSVAWNRGDKAQWIATGSADKTARVWSLEDPKDCVDLSMTGGEVERVMFGKDNSVLTLSRQGVAELWRDALPKGEGQEHSYRAPPLRITPREDVKDATFNADGTQIATVSTLGIVRIWDAKTLSELAHITTKQGPLKKVDFPVAPKGGSGERLAPFVLTIGEDDSMLLWDVSNPRMPKSLSQEPLHPDENVSVTAWSVAPSGIAAFVGYSDGTVLLWNAQNRQTYPLHARGEQGESAPADGPAHDSYVTSVIFNSNLGLSGGLLTTSADGMVRIWDVDHELAEVAVMRHPSHILKAAFSSDGKQFVTADSEKQASLWKSQPDIMGEFPPVFSATTFGRGSGRFVGLVRKDYVKVGLAMVMDTSESEPAPAEPILLHDGQATPTAELVSATISADGSDPAKKKSIIVGVKQDGSVLVWSDKDHDHPMVLPVKRKAETTPELSEDGARVLVVSESGKAQIYSTATPVRLLKDFTATSGTIVVATLSMDGKRVAAGTTNGDTLLWDLDPPAQGPQGPSTRRSEKDPKDSIQSVAFSKDGSRILVISSDGAVRVWNWDNGSEACFRDKQNKGDKCTDLELKKPRLSPDGKWVAALSDERALLWSVDKPDSPTVLGEPGVLTVAFNNTSDNKSARVVTGSKDGKVRLWEVKPERSRPWSELAGHTSPVVWAEFSQDDKFLLTRSEENDVWAWKVDIAGLQKDLQNAIVDCLLPKELEKYLGDTNTDIEELRRKCKDWQSKQRDKTVASNPPAASASAPPAPSAPSAPSAAPSARPATTPHPSAPPAKRASPANSNTSLPHRSG